MKHETKNNGAGVPQVRRDFRTEFSWRIFRIMSEFIEGFQFLADLKREVSIFGSTRFKEKNHHYKEARELARRLGKAGFTIVTGGGPGIMEAANRGAFEAGAPSVGLNIQLPHDQRTNRFVKKGIGFHYFFTRKVMLAYSAQAYIYFPGGYGTLSEFFDIVELVQTGKMERIPIICVGRDYWGALDGWIKEHILRVHHAINPADVNIYRIAKNVDEAYRMIVKTKERAYE